MSQSHVTVMRLSEHVHSVALKVHQDVPVSYRDYQTYVEEVRKVITQSLSKQGGTPLSSKVCAFNICYLLLQARSPQA